jgi:hypothetical protein
MSVPFYLQGNVRFREDAGVVDVATVITNLKAEALALSPPWTDLGGDEIKSPVDSSGRFMKILLTRILATTLEIRVRDTLDRQFTRRAQFVASMTTRYYVGQFHVAVDFSNGEGFWANILDLSPEAQNAHDQYVLGMGARTAAGADDFRLTPTGTFALEDSSPRVYIFIRTPVLDVVDGLAPRLLVKTTGDSRVFYPILSYAKSVPLVYRLRGKFCQMLHLPVETDQTEFAVPIDLSTTGLFKVLSFPDSDGNGFKIVARKS